MSIREVIEMLVEIFKFLSTYLGDIFGGAEEAPAEGETATF